YAHTCLSESQRESSSQAASGASDQRHLPLQIHPLKPLAVWLPDRPSARITGPPPVAPPASRRSTPADAPHRKPPPAPPLSSSPAPPRRAVSFPPSIPTRGCQDRRAASSSWRQIWPQSL